MHQEMAEHTFGPMGRCGKDGFPRIEMSMMTSNQQSQYTELLSKWNTLKNLKRNSRPFRQEKIRHQEKLKACQDRYKKATQAMESVLKNANRLWLEVVGPGGGTTFRSGSMAVSMPGSSNSHGKCRMSSDAGDTKMVCSETFENMIEKAVAVGAQRALQQHQRQQPPLALTDGMNEVKAMAVETMLNTHFNRVLSTAVEVLRKREPDIVKEAAVQQLVGNPTDEVLVAAAKKYAQENEESVKEAVVQKLVEEPTIELLESAAEIYGAQNQESVEEKAAQQLAHQPTEEVLEEAARKYAKENEKSVEEQAVQMLVEEPTEEVLEAAAKKYALENSESVRKQAVKQLLAEPGLKRQRLF